MFEINSNTEIIVAGFSDSTPVRKAIERMHRDMNAVLFTSSRQKSCISIIKDETLSEEKWVMDALQLALTIRAFDELAVIYSLFYISEHCLGIKPLWFWNDQELLRTEFHLLDVTHLESRENAFRYRGWFINDEVLFLGWRPYGSDILPWEMAFEALLRLGGNIVIPGTDKDAARFAPLASSMGLWITHHHAEPLGAEMFSRAYPDKTPSFLRNADLYRNLWRKAAEKQKDMKVLWTLGFRGQGDKPFWEEDPSYDTDEKRAEVINGIISEQASIVSEYVDDPRFAYNIYNESVNLYRKGLLHFPEGTVKLFADNGYGKMVTRREGNTDRREKALPLQKDEETANGMYYHVSFYDLQCANHITPTPVSFALQAEELNNAYRCGIRDAIIVNVSNVKPHLAAISLLADFWRDGVSDGDTSLKKYISSYFSDDPDSVIAFMNCYCEASLSFGQHEDNKGGDQAAAFPLRMLASSWVRGEQKCTDYAFILDASLDEQAEDYHSRAMKAASAYSSLLDDIDDHGVSQLLSDDFRYAVEWFSFAYNGACCFTDAYKAYRENRLEDALVLLGDAAVSYDRADDALKKPCHDKWEGFFSNDALTDTSAIVALMKNLMEWVRIIGDGPGFWRWQRDLTYPEEDRNVVLITNYEKRMSAYEMYLVYKTRMSEDPKL